MKHMDVSMSYVKEVKQYTWIKNGAQKHQHLVANYLRDPNFQVSS
jgi:hypothetical protein